ncbi:helix-turn-helix domain-containing protein, partial [Neisseria sp. S1]|uniref:helix-turn-helix domain-containing protein n=1 Tax=Neisseria sp. S1 TaxID=3318354 RepID=UPI003A88A9E7
ARSFYCTLCNGVTISPSHSIHQNPPSPHLSHRPLYIYLTWFQPHYFQLTPTIRHSIQQLLQNQQPEPWATMYQHTQAMVLMTQVLQHLFPVSLIEDHDSGCLKSKRLQRLMSLLKHPDFQAANLEYLALACHSNPTTLQQEFQAAFGISIARYRREQIFRTACELLEQKLSVAEVAQKVGYDNTECFSKAFKKYFGRSPREFCRSLI